MRQNQHQRRRKWWRYVAGVVLVGLIVAGMWPAAIPVETGVVQRGNRLSVQPVEASEWKVVLKLGGLPAGRASGKGAKRS